MFLENARLVVFRVMMLILSEDRDSKVLQNAGVLPHHYTVSKFRSQLESAPP